MTRWFRFYDDVLDDPKVQRLPPDVFRQWVNLLCLASKGRGKLPPLSEIAFRLRISDREADSLIMALLDAGLIDENGGSMEPHNWHQRQFCDAGAAERMKRYRERKRNERNALRVTNVTVTSQESDTDTEKKEIANAILSETSSDTVSEKPKTKKRKAYPEAFETFWKAYPTDPLMSKKAACEAWDRLIPEDREKAGQAVPAFAKHCQANPDYRPVHAVRFLSQRRFDGFAGETAAPQFMSDSEFQKWWKERHRSPVQ